MSGFSSFRKWMERNAAVNKANEMISSRSWRRGLRLACLSLAGVVLAQRPLIWGQEADQQKPARATLQGHLHDAAGGPVAHARVILREASPSQSKETSTDGGGEFSFDGLASGDFTLIADTGSRRSAAKQISISKAAADARMQLTADLVLGGTNEREDAGQAMEFADKPDFAIAAVTDWTAAGGHGSDASLRMSEALTRDAVKMQSGSAEAKGADADFKTSEWNKQSENELRSAVDRNPKDAAANRALGEFYFRAGRYKDAVDYLRAGHDSNPVSFDIELELAQALRLAGDPAQAKEHVEKLLAKHDTADLHRMEGELDESLGDPLGAVHQFQIAASEDPSETNYFAWGSELLIHRAIWQAKEVFDEGAKRYPKSARMLTARGAALFAGARYDEAALDLCRASDLAPDSAEPYLFMGKIEIAAPNPLPCVVDELARFQKLKPSDSLANFYYAMALKKQHGSETDTHTLEQVRDLLTRAVTLDPKCAVGYLELGNLSAGGKQWEQAIGYYLKAIQTDEELSEAHYRLGVAYQRAGWQDLAREQFKLHDEIADRQAAEIQRQREAVKQFLVVLPEQKGQRLAQ